MANRISSGEEKKKREEIKYLWRCIAKPKPPRAVTIGR